MEAVHSPTLRCYILRDLQRFGANFAEFVTLAGQSRDRSSTDQGAGKWRVVGIGVRLPFASWENYCVWEFLALRQPNSAWLGLGVALANMLPSTAQGGMRSESAEVPLNAGAKPNAQA